MEPPRAVGNAVVVLFLATLVVLGVRSLATHDTRFGWGMFSHETDYRVSYSWVAADGSYIPFDSGDDLQERQTIIDDHRPHSTRYGIGAVRAWVGSYIAHKYEERPRGVVAVRADIDYRVNMGPMRSSTIVHPSDHRP